MRQIVLQFFSLIMFTYKLLYPVISKLLSYNSFNNIEQLKGSIKDLWPCKERLFSQDNMRESKQIIFSPEQTDLSMFGSVQAPALTVTHFSTTNQLP